MIDKAPSIVQQAWRELQKIGGEVCLDEPVLSPFITNCILKQASFNHSISCILSNELTAGILETKHIFQCFLEILESNVNILISIATDLYTHCKKDPACDSLLTAYLYFKGFHALVTYRIYHQLWLQGQRSLAQNLHYQCTREYDVDIHPGATIGRGLMIDHATGVVIGETAILEDNISILHGVTLGGSGKERGKRHPTIRSGVLLSTGAKILGNIEIGINAKVAASSLVLESVPNYATVAGVPAKVMKIARDYVPAENMEHKI